MEPGKRRPDAALQRSFRVPERRRGFEWIGEVESVHKKLYVNTNITKFQLFLSI